MNIKTKNNKEILNYLKSKLNVYMTAKQPLDLRVKENAKWFKGENWDVMKKGSSSPIPEPTSSYIFNAVAAKHADAMDNYPSPIILPREPKDSDCADMLTSIIPYILEKNNFKQIYSKNWWCKLKNGGCVYGVFYNNKKEDIEISKVDLSRIYWAPGIEDIQKSPYLFILSYEDKSHVEYLYPHSKGKLYSEFFSESLSSDEDKCVVVDCYLKTPAKNGKDAVHLIKFSGDTILDSTLNRETTKDKGLYLHGKYPFVIDNLYPDDLSPVGFGIIDIAKNPQGYIDRLDKIISENALISGKVRWLIKDSGGINENELLDLSTDVVHVAGSVNDDNIKEFQARTLAPFICEHRQNKIQELKEVIGNRDTNNGSAQNGITAYGAIVALQEAGNKLVRDMIFDSYTAYGEIIRQIIDLIIQFYDKKQFYRITGKSGTSKFLEFDNSVFNAGSIFDISVRAEVNSPLSRESLNSLALTFFEKGFFKPENKDSALTCLELMSFDGKEKIINILSSNS